MERLAGQHYDFLEQLALAIARLKVLRLVLWTIRIRIILFSCSNFCSVQDEALVG